MARHFSRAESVGRHVGEAGGREEFEGARGVFGQVQGGELRFDADAAVAALGDGWDGRGEGDGVGYVPAVAGAVDGAAYCGWWGGVGGHCR